MVEAAVGGAEAGPGKSAGAPRRRRKIFVVLGVFLAVVAVAVGGGLAWAVVLPNMQGRGEYEVVPHAAKVLDATEGLDRRIASKLKIETDRGWDRTGAGVFTYQSTASWAAFTGLVRVDVHYSRYAATALKSGAAIAAAEMDKLGDRDARPIGGLGDEAIGTPVPNGFQIDARDRNVVIRVSFNAPSKKWGETEAHARPMAATALALLKEANR
ncbi:hypothetical protein [Actinomadura chokoriensis]|uniref:hypothetical protein n=1 Tax=Actinomadura chokoriensis TaxID=454156 RepID=UPI0031F84D46